METIPFPQDIELDDDGYPPEEWLDALAKANDIAGLSTWMIKTFHEIVAAIGYGNTRSYAAIDDFQKPMVVIKYSTGGWSGQEEMISALQKTAAFMLYAYSWHRGGHYEFRVPMEGGV